MARNFNFKCDFTEGFFACGIPRDAIQLVLKMKWGKHTLTEDHERRTEVTFILNLLSIRKMLKTHSTKF